jgi:hypothetical protein
VKGSKLLRHGVVGRAAVGKHKPEQLVGRGYVGVVVPTMGQKEGVRCRGTVTAWAHLDGEQGQQTKNTGHDRIF